MIKGLGKYFFSCLSHFKKLTLPALLSLAIAPANAMAIGSPIVRIKSRINKEVKPQEDKGDVRYYLDPEDVDISKDNWYLLARNGYMLISMSSTQLKKARRWNSMMMGLKVPHPNGTMVTPASFSHSYKVSSVQEKNDKGSW